jgi:hypothetical protein
LQYAPELSQLLHDLDGVERVRYAAVIRLAAGGRWMGVA